MMFEFDAEHFAERYFYLIKNHCGKWESASGGAVP
jgi:hypothetical protein